MPCRLDATDVMLVTTLANAAKTSMAKRIPRYSCRRRMIFLVAIYPT